MRILDLFCGAGGASMGYHRAFPDADITGVDLAPQPDYPFGFVQGDAIEFLDLQVGFDLIHASPPCQSYTPMSNRHGSQEPELIGVVRDAITSLHGGTPYVIENVVGSGADLNATLMLCGTMFGLPTARHRLFETSWLIMQPPHLFHDHEGLVSVYGKPDGRRLFTRVDGSELRAWSSLREGQEALGVPWIMDWHQVREAIPPAYTQFIGEQFVEGPHE